MKVMGGAISFVQSHILILRSNLFTVSNRSVLPSLARAEIEGNLLVIMDNTEEMHPDYLDVAD